MEESDAPTAIPDFRSIRHKKKRAFLAAFSVVGNIKLAAERAGCSRDIVQHWKRNDPQFLHAFGIARDSAADVLEAEAWRRAVKGNKKPVFHNGVVVGYEDVRSDVLLIFLLKAARPKKFRDNHYVKSQSEHTERHVEEKNVTLQILGNPAALDAANRLAVELGRSSLLASSPRGDGREQGTMEALPAPRSPDDETV